MKTFFIDFDGSTPIDDKGKIRNDFKNFLVERQSEGDVVIYTTGRVKERLLDGLSSFSPNYIVTETGSKIFKKNDNGEFELVKIYTLDDNKKTALSRLLGKPLYYTTSENRINSINLEPETIDGMKKSGVFVVKSNIQNMINEFSQISQITVKTQEDILKNITIQGFNVYKNRSGYDITASTKGESAKWLIENLLKHTDHDDIVCIGDSKNDVSLFGQIPNAQKIFVGNEELPELSEIKHIKIELDNLLLYLKNHYDGQ